VEPWACSAPGQASYGAYGSAAPSSSGYGSGYASGGGSAVADGGTNYVIGPDAGVPAALVIADQWNNRVLVVRSSGEVLWSFGDGNASAGPASVITPNDAELLATGDLLIAGTGAASGPGSSCSGLPSGALADDRVLIIDHATKAIAWQYGGHDTAAGATAGLLSGPTFAVYVPGGSSCGDTILITDQANHRLVEVDRSTKSVVWDYPVSGTAGGTCMPSTPTAAGAPDAGAGDASTLDAQAVVPDGGSTPGYPVALPTPSGTFTPQSAERLPDGHTLVTDQGNNVILEVDTGGTIVWEYPPAGGGGSGLNTPAFASRLPNGNTLIADTNNNRVIVVDHSAAASIVWSYSPPWPSNLPNPAPTGAVRLKGGNTLITLSGTNQVVEVALDQTLLYSHGQNGGAGNLPDELNAPYNAKAACDYTGLTNAAALVGCVSP
jgi:hypothetical protein